MPALKYRVTLTEYEKAMLEGLLRKGKSAARKQTRARILLKSAEGCTVDEIVTALAISADTVGNIRQRCVEEGVEAALLERPRPGQKPKLTERQNAHVIAIACSDPPTGHDHWTLRLLADKVVELEYAESYSHEAVRQLLKKHAQTVAKAGMVSIGGRRGLRGGDGRCLGCL